MAKAASQRRTTKNARSKTTDGTAKRQSASGKAVPAAEHVQPVSLNRPAAAQPRKAAAQSGTRPSSAVPPTSAPRQERERPAAASRQRGTGSLVAAGLVGGLVAFVLTTVVQWTILEPEQAERDAEIAALSEELDALSGSLSGGGDADAASVDLQSLSEQVEALSQGLADLSQASETAEADTPAPDNAPSADDLAALDERLGGIESELAPLRGGLSASEGSRAELAATLEGLQSEIAALQSTALADIAARLDAVEAELADETAEQRVARAFAAAELKSAIDRGGSFAAELDAYEAIAADQAAPAALADYAESGVPTREELVRAFPDVARSMMAAIETEGSAGMVDRLMSSARSLVTIRTDAEASGEGPEAAIARMEDALVAGNLETAIAEWQSLPDVAQSASAAFAEGMQARLAAERVLSDTLSAASDAAAAETN